MAKQKYFIVTNPAKKVRIIAAETKFDAGAKASGLDNGIYVFKDYKIRVSH